MRVRVAFSVVAFSALAGLAVQITADGQDKPKKLSVEEIEAFLSSKGVHEAFVPAPPRGFSSDDMKKHIPADNPLTRAKVELGRQLYFDARLSRDGTVSCASCHAPKFGFGDGQPTSTGIKGQKGGRNAPTVINRLFSGVQFWDGRAASLEAQALGPIGNPIEMGFTVEEACKVVAGIPGYRLQVKAVFGSDKVLPEHLAKAMASYERTVISGDSPYDIHTLAEQYSKVDLTDEDLDADTKARIERTLAEAKTVPYSEAARRGEKLFFGKAACSLCHTGANFTDELYHNLGVGMGEKEPDLGRFGVTKVEKDKGAFKTPGLRNVADNGPYMHDGKTKTLLAVVELYNKGGEKNTWLSERIKPLGLSEQEQQDLVEFMKSLSGRMAAQPEPRLP